MQAMIRKLRHVCVAVCLCECGVAPLPCMHECSMLSAPLLRAAIMRSDASRSDKHAPLVPIGHCARSSRSNDNDNGRTDNSRSFERTTCVYVCIKCIYTNERAWCCYVLCVTTLCGTVSNASFARFLVCVCVCFFSNEN